VTTLLVIVDGLLRKHSALINERVDQGYWRLIMSKYLDLGFTPGTYDNKLRGMGRHNGVLYEQVGFIPPPGQPMFSDEDLRTATEAMESVRRSAGMSPSIRSASPHIHTSAFAPSTDIERVFGQTRRRTYTVNSVDEEEEDIDEWDNA